MTYRPRVMMEQQGRYIPDAPSPYANRSQQRYVPPRRNALLETVRNGHKIADRTCPLPDALSDPRALEAAIKQLANMILVQSDQELSDIVRQGNGGGKSWR